jgi:GNAT superfamily N-acetyltransferase
MTIEYRPATRDDLPVLHRLYGQLEHEATNLNLDRLGGIFERIERYPDYTVWIALEDGVVVGTFALVIIDALGARCQPLGLVEDVVVDDPARGRGIGRAMMEFAIARCRERGCYKMQLSSSLRREDAHRFYDSLGFERHGVSFRVRV